MARIRLTTSEVDALREARFRCRMDTPSELLRAAIDGDETAVKALREAWPKGEGESIDAWTEIAKLRRDAGHAGRSLDAKKVARIANQVAALEKQHPSLPPDVMKRDAFVTLSSDVTNKLQELAKFAPRVGPGRPSVADGIRMLLNGYGKEKVDA